MIFCEKCGAQMEDGTIFCEQCGAKLEVAAEAAAPAETEAANPISALLKNKKLVGIGAVAIAAVVVLLLIGLIFGGGAKGAALRYVRAVEKGNARAVVNSMPKKVLKETLDNMDMDKKEYIEMLEERYEERDDYRDEYDIKGVSYKVLGQYSVDKETLKDLKDYYDDEYDLKISAAKVVVLQVTTRTDDGVEKSHTAITMVKGGGKWFVD